MAEQLAFAIEGELAAEAAGLENTASDGAVQLRFLLRRFGLPMPPQDPESEIESECAQMHPGPKSEIESECAQMHPGSIFL